MEIKNTHDFVNGTYPGIVIYLAKSRIIDQPHSRIETRFYYDQEEIDHHVVMGELPVTPFEPDFSRKIRWSKWLDNPVNLKRINEIADKKYNEIASSIHNSSQ